MEDLERRNFVYSQLWFLNSFAQVNNSGWQNSAVMIAINPDKDNRVDVLSFDHEQKIHFREWNGVALVEKSGWPIDFAPLLPVPPVVGDVDGDNEEEIVIATYNPEALQDTGSGIRFSNSNFPHNCLGSIL